MDHQPLPDISVKQMDAIASLARFGSFVAAASHLGISQPGLSRIIQQAEKRLGAKLFIRGSRSVALTPAGRDFLPFAEQILADFALQVERIRRSKKEPALNLAIASLMSVSHLVLPNAVMQFRANYPEVFIEVREGVGSTVYEDIRSGAADFGVGHLGDLPPEIETESVLEENFFAVLHCDHPLAKREILQLTDLKDVPLVSMPPESGLRHAIDKAAAGAGVELLHSVVTNQYGSLFGFVANGLGITIVPASALPPGETTTLTIRALNPAITRQIAVMHLANQPLNKVSEAFLRVLRPLLVSATQGTRNLLG